MPKGTKNPRTHQYQSPGWACFTLDNIWQPPLDNQAAECYGSELILY